MERDKDLCLRSSYNNQARIHNGYHYPRSFQTANRSRVNFPVFIRDFKDCVVDDFVHLYCLGRERSKVTARQFQRFCGAIGAPLKPASDAHRKLFNLALIEEVFEVQEFAFDADILRDFLRTQLGPCRDGGPGACGVGGWACARAHHPSPHYIMEGIYLRDDP